MTPIHGMSGEIFSTFVWLRIHHPSTKEIAQVSADNLLLGRWIFLDFCRILRQKSHILRALLAIVPVYFAIKGQVKI